jgi:hypothetical protein
MEVKIIQTCSTTRLVVSQVLQNAPHFAVFSGSYSETEVSKQLYSNLNGFKYITDSGLLGLIPDYLVPFEKISNGRKAACVAPALQSLAQ